MTEAVKQKREVVPISKHFEAERQVRPGRSHITWIGAIDPATGKASSACITVRTSFECNLESDDVDVMEWEPVTVTWSSSGIPAPGADDVAAFAEALVWAVGEARRIEQVIGKG